MDNEISILLSDDPKNWWIDRMYLQEAWSSAEISKDPRTQVGCALVVPGQGVILSSHNQIPSVLQQRGFQYDLERKNYCTEHAERSVIFKALKNGIPVGGLTLYGTWIACAECSRAIIEFGITRVVTLSGLVEKTPERWTDSMRLGLHMMRQAGLDVVGWRGDLGVKNTILFNGQTVGNEDLQ